MAVGSISPTTTVSPADASEGQQTAASSTQVREDALRELMVRYQAGDRVAADELIRQISPQLTKFLSGAYLNQNETEDLLQDCWIRIHRARHTYRSNEPLLPWVYAIARHTRLDAYRKRRRTMTREVLVDTVPEPPPQLQTGPEVLALLDQLPEPQREALVMLKVVGMSLEEVAKATASTAGAVKQRAHRAYVRLRDILEGQSLAGKK